MARLLAFAFLFAATVTLHAAPPYLEVRVYPERIRVEPGERLTITTYTVAAAAEPATNVHLLFELTGDGTIEGMQASDLWQCTVGTKNAECVKAEMLPYTSDPIPVFVRADPVNGGRLTLQVTMSAAQTPVEHSLLNATSDVRFYHLAIVDTIEDSGPGSFRAAIEEANGVMDAPAKIVFHLPGPVPAEGWFTLTPVTPLPPITASSIYLDGASQTRFSGDTNAKGPEIAIDGHLAHYGLEVHSPCDSIVEGLAIGRFDRNQGLWYTHNGKECVTQWPYEIQRWVKNNYIGTDPTGTVAWPNLRGLRLDFGVGRITNNLISGNTYSGIWAWATDRQWHRELYIDENRFGTAADGITPLPNGAAGMLFGPRVTAKVRQNIIANHPGMGVAIVPGETYIDIRQNSMRDNGGIGIDWGIDGASPSHGPDVTRQPNAPKLLGGRYDPAIDRTFFTVSVETQRLPDFDGSVFSLDFYANRGPDGDGEEWLGSAGNATQSNGEPFEVDIAGDHRNKWVNATNTRVPLYYLRPPDISSEAPGFNEYSTSELSNAIFTQP
jgi:hypothetical protein